MAGSTFSEGFLITTGTINIFYFEIYHYFFTNTTLAQELTDIHGVNKSQQKLRGRIHQNQKISRNQTYQKKSTVDPSPKRISQAPNRDSKYGMILN